MKSIKGLSKGLKALAFLAAHGSATVRELAHGLSIPEPTAARILETLRADGFVLRVRARRQYWATSKLANLAQSVPPLPLIVELAGAHLDTISATLNVPVMVCARGDAQRLEVLRANTRVVKPTITRFVPGYTFPVQGTASGLVMTAFDESRPMQRSRARSEEVGATMGEQRLVRRNGYAIADNRLEQRENCLAVPILIDGRAHACMEIRCMKAVASESAIQRQYLPLLRRHANEIAIGASAWL